MSAAMNVAEPAGHNVPVPAAAPASSSAAATTAPASAAASAASASSSSGSGTLRLEVMAWAQGMKPAELQHQHDELAKLYDALHDSSSEANKLSTALSTLYDMLDLDEDVVTARLKTLATVGSAAVSAGAAAAPRRGPPRSVHTLLGTDQQPKGWLL